MKTYIQIGANLGNDEFYQKICNLSEPVNLYLIEANSQLIEQLKKNYTDYSNISNSKLYFINVAIVPFKHQNTVELFLGISDQFNSVLNRKSYNLSEGSIQVNAMTFDEFIKMFNIDSIEYLCVDIEGLDYSVINSINFDLYSINQIECELWPYDVDSTENFPTGPTFLDNVLIPKMSKKYNVEIGSSNIIFTRKKINYDV